MVDPSTLTPPNDNVVACGKVYAYGAEIVPPLITTVDPSTLTPPNDNVVAVGNI